MQTSQRLPTSLGKTPNSFVGPHPLPRSHSGLLLRAPPPAQVCANLRAFVPALSTDSSRHTLFHLSHHPGLCLNLIYSQRPSMTTLSKVASLVLFKTTVCFFSFILQIVCIEFILLIICVSPRMQISRDQKIGFVPCYIPGAYRMLWSIVGLLYRRSHNCRYLSGHLGKTSSVNASWCVYSARAAEMKNSAFLLEI